MIHLRSVILVNQRDSFVFDVTNCSCRFILQSCYLFTTVIHSSCMLYIGDGDSFTFHVTNYQT